MYVYDIICKIEGIFPEMLKLSSITPVHKAGCTMDVANNRPISILSHFSQLLESIVFDFTRPYVNNIVCNKQHGFRSGCSTLICNMVFTKYVFDAFSNHTQRDMIHLDFSNAFDKVNHNALFSVLKQTGFGEPLLSWFKTYLFNRKQFVKVYGVQSKVADVPCGVSQGSYPFYLHYLF